MPPPPELAALAGRRRYIMQATAANLLVLLRRLWRRVDPAAVLASWDGAAARQADLLTRAGQLAAADGAQAYVSMALALQDIRPAPAGTVAPAALAGVASDGRPLDTLLRQPAIQTVVLLSRGVERDMAMASGLQSLERIATTQVADASRVAAQVAMVNDHRCQGYIRMLNPPSCSRCVVLAGRWYAHDASFQRHPRCDCVGVPASEDAAGDVRTDPKAYFDNLPAAEQDRVFTAAGAESIRLGADVSRVVNARRGAAGLAPAGARLTEAERRSLTGGTRGHLTTTKVFGQDVFVTTEGTTRRRSVTPRLMPESILQAAGGDRDEAVRLLKRFGYLF